MATLLENARGSAPTSDHGHGAADQRAFLAHHFDTPQQQFEASKFGMWMFLATEVLLFGGLFCAYAVFRGNHPEIFTYGSQFLDTTWGAINTIVLILSSLTMAIAVWCAQCGRQRELVLFLGLTLMCAVDFMGIKYIEYSHKIHDNLVWGLKFYEDPRPGTVAPSVEPAVLEPGDAEQGRNLYLRTCLSCHGPTGEGLPGLGKPLRTSEFVAGLDDGELLAFLKTGRPVRDPLNTSGLPMLPRGGNPNLMDQDLVHIIAHLRVLQQRAIATGRSTAEEEAMPAGTAASVIPQSVIPPAATGPRGPVRLPEDAEAPEAVRAERLHVDPRHDPTRPSNAHLFFAIYFGMTGLHGMHVVAGMIVITWLLVRALKGHFTPQYFTPVDLGGLYWHIVDVIWIFLFPLLYLIR